MIDQLVKRASQMKNILYKNEMKVQFSNPFSALLISISIFLIACDKEVNPPISQGQMWDCHLEMAWDSTTMKENLMGEWDWKYIGCFWNPEDANDDEFKSLSIEFKSNKTLDVKENGQVIQVSNWNVAYVEADLMAIDVDPRVAQLEGLILLCDEWLEFNNGYIDGCNNYFIRKD